MRNKTIKDRNSGKIIAQIDLNNPENVINSIKSKNNLDFRYMDLKKVNLDDTKFTNTDFSYSNFTGANISEAIFINCDFSFADLLDTCMCYSIFINCNFKETRFGATDISMAEFNNCIFTGYHSFSLNFADCKKITNCRYISECNQICPINSPPIFISGLNQPIAIMDKHIWTRGKIYNINNK